MELLKFVTENPGSSSVIVVALLTFAGQAAITWDTIRYLKKNMVTHKDLRIALLEFKEFVRDDFITKEECRLLIEEENGK